MLRISAIMAHRSSCRFDKCVVVRCMSSRPLSETNHSNEKVNAMVGHNFPDFIEQWNRSTFKAVGNGLIAVTALCAVGGVVATTTVTVSSLVPSAVMGALTAGYWYIGSNDIKQTSHAIRRNFPVIGNLRYVLEVVRIIV